VATRQLRALTVVAVVIVACELLAAGSRIGHIAAAGARALDRGGATVQAADLDTLAFYVPPEALVQAQSLMPRHAVYAVAIDGKADSGAILAFKYALLPRVYTTDRKRAQWVIAYKVPSEGLGVPYRREIGLAPDVNLVEVRH
jgi:hypothetical protein